MTAKEIRKKYLEFFTSKGHKVIPSASLVPENDPTTLFTGSGMQPMLPYLLGETHPQGKRVVDSQKSFRAEDIDEVGDSRHTTFFEMLGNWSFGDYWKEEQISWVFEFLTQVVGLDADKLSVTVFGGDKDFDVPKDDETPEIWKKVGIPEERIFTYGSKENWWSRAGVPENMPVGEPGGPDSEIFYEFTDVKHDPKYGKLCHPNCECGRFFEIGNSVFMEYRKVSDTKFEKLKQRNVDFGGGLERIAAASLDDADVFKIDLFTGIIEEAEKFSDLQYSSDPKSARSFQIIADHLRGAVFIISEGTEPSNTGQGYIVRRLLRRAIRHADFLHIKSKNFTRLVDLVVEPYEKVYENLTENIAQIKSSIEQEEKKFRKALDKGRKELIKQAGTGKIDLFTLFSTHGLPPDVSLDELNSTVLPELKLELLTIEQKKELMQKFDIEFEAHQEISRTATAGTFKGGLADHSDKVIQLHTTTHLMQAALRRVLGDQVFQKGSNITKDRTRFDFAHPDKMTDEQKQEVETQVNDWIKKDLPVKKEFMTPKEAKKLGAIGLFDEKYGEEVSVYTITDSNTDQVISREFCGGPHVEHTGMIKGKFSIGKEQSASSGVRRIKGVLE